MLKLPFLSSLNAKLDRSLARLDQKGYTLKHDASPMRRFIWRIAFNDPNKLQLETSSALKGKRVRGKPSKIIHVVNVIDPQKIDNDSLQARVTLALTSIERAKQAGVEFLGATAGSSSLPSWKPLFLKRSAASELGSKRDFAFLKDLLDAAAAQADDDDLLFYSNADCAVAPEIYQKLLRENKAVTEFFRKDIQCEASYDEIFKAGGSIYEIGIDALAIKKSVYKEIRDQLPDCIIGEPHWDTVFSGILHKNYEVSQNTEDLYHIKHEQQWDDNSLTEGGLHNKHLYLDAISYGLMEDEIISLRKQTVIILLKSALEADDETHISQLISSLSPLASTAEVVFCEFTEGNSPFAKLVNHIKYFPLFNTNDYTKPLSQEACIINLLLHYFSSFKNIIIFKDTISNISPLLLKQIRLSLQAHGAFQNDHLIAVKNSKISENELDIYGDNAILLSESPENVCFVNDDGLLELLSNHAANQSF